MLSPAPAPPEVFRLLAETATDLIVIVDEAGTLLYANAAAEPMLGYAPDDLVGRPLTTLMPEAMRPAHHAGFARYLASGERRLDWAHVEVPGRRRDGTELPLAISFAEYRLGGARHFTGIVRDVSAQRAAEAALRDSRAALEALNATLEAQVRERTARTRALAARLAVAERDERRRIAYVLHDDLQQQLFALSIILELSRRDDSDTAELIGQAQQTVRGVMDLTRTLASELSPSLPDTDALGDVLRALADAQREDYGLEVEVVGAATVPDPALSGFIYQLVREALFNVVKHAGTRQARIRIAEGEGHVEVRIEDDGAGFDPAVLPDVREGFGLASLRERLELVGGRLDLDTAPGAGTRVTLVVPRDGPAM